MMKNKLLLALLLLTVSVTSCESLVPLQNFQTDNIAVRNLKVSDKKGVTLTTRIHLADSFTTKANTNGEIIKKISNIRSLKVYLLKTTTATIAAGSDPLSGVNIVYQNTINVSPAGDLALNFVDVQGSTAAFASGSYYHVAVRAFDAINGGGNELIKDNNGGAAWTGTTAATPKVAVSLSGPLLPGVQVRTTDLAVSTTNNFDIIINLSGMLPTSNVTVKINDGLPARVKSYAINFCTNPNQPDFTKVPGAQVIVNAGSTELVGDFLHKLEIAGLTTAGTYYLTVQGYDGPNATGNSYIRPDNERAVAYTAPDGGKNIAVSSNSLTLDANLNYNFSTPLTPYFDVKANFSYFISTFAGIGSAPYSGPNPTIGDGGQATSAKLNGPADAAFDSAGNMYIADQGNSRVRKITTATGIITTYAGGGAVFGNGGPATSAQLNAVTGLAFDAQGNLILADTNNDRIRKVTTATGIITTIAGTGTRGYLAAQDGNQATSANLNAPDAIAFDSAANIYFTDAGNRRIRKITTATGIITTIAGIGSAPYSGPNPPIGDGGQATSADIGIPDGIAFDSTGNIYFSGNNRIRKITVATGIVTTIAGGGGSLGDGGPATSAQLNAPYHINFDISGNLYIAELSGNRLRKVNMSSGIITTIAGNGSAGSVGDGGIGISAQLNGPVGVVADPSGNIYVSEYNGSRVRKLN